jgi:hypothetical protein
VLHRFVSRRQDCSPLNSVWRRALLSTWTGPLQDELGESDPCIFVIEYCDGFRAFLLGMGSYSVPRNIDDGQIYGDWGYAARVDDEVVGCEFFLQNTGAPRTIHVFSQRQDSHLDFNSISLQRSELRCIDSQVATPTSPIWSETSTSSSRLGRRLTMPLEPFLLLVRESPNFLSWQCVLVPTLCLLNLAIVTGIADASLRSVAAGCARIETPLLHVSYESFDDEKPPIRPCVLHPRTLLSLERLTEQATTFAFWCRPSLFWCCFLSSTVHHNENGDAYRWYTDTIHGPQVRLKTSTHPTTIGRAVVPVGRAPGASRSHLRKHCSQSVASKAICATLCVGALIGTIDNLRMHDTFPV